METLSVAELRKQCPVKWHSDVPKDGISLGVADVDFKGPEGVIEFIKSNLIEDFSFYQNQQGLSNAINVATNHLENKSIPLKEENVQIIDGTMMGIYISMKWISEKPGDLLVLGPIYEPIHRHATSTGNKLHWTPISEKGLNHNHIQEIVDNQKIKMITMCNPTNPIGHIFSDSDLKFLRDLSVDNNLFVFSDELYEPLWFNKEHKSIASLDDMQSRSILLYGFSKAYGLAGYRAGFMHIGPEIEKVKHIASQIMVSPSPIASLVTEFALENQNAINWVKNFKEHCQRVTKFASNMFIENGYESRTPESCFFVYPQLNVDDEKFSNYLLKTDGVQVVAGSVFGPSGKGHIRVNCATSEDRLSNGIDRIIKSLKNFS